MAYDPSSHRGSNGVPYTIEQALALMKQLPLEGLNERLVVSVMRTTLESAGVSIPLLLQLAGTRQDEVTTEIVRLQDEISSLHAAIDQKTAEVRYYQETLAEIGTLQDRFKA